MHAPLVGKRGHRSGHVAVAHFIAAALVAASGCSDTKTSPKSTNQASPNASILPAPLAAASELAGAGPARPPREGAPAESAGRPVVREEPPPEAAPVDRPLPEDTLTARDVAGYSVTGEFRWADVPQPAPVPEASASVLRELGQKMGLSVTVDLGSAGRLRCALDSPAFPLPARAELRSRFSYYGHALVWPDGRSYRVVLPGALRALFAERRADVSPLLRAKASPAGTGTQLGHKTTRTTIETSLGVMNLEQATVVGSGHGGELLCRLLVELIGVDPTTETCREERIPLSAQYRWATSGGLSFVATSLVERKDFTVAGLAVPPPGAAFAPGELPPAPNGVLLGRDDLARLRTRSIVASEKPGPRAPAEGITVDNQTTVLEYLLLDGIPVAWVKPKAEEHVSGLLRGRYTVSLRDFFGAQVSPPALMELPAFVRAGTSDSDAGRP